jgi:membrane protein YqaA with SNARE-associated domain
LLIESIERFASGRRAVVFVGGWAFLEAIFLPVVPDVALLLLVLAAPRRAVALFMAVIAGSVLGTAVLAVLAIAAPQQAHSLVLAVPGVRPEMFADATTIFATGSPAPFAAFGPGTPLKVLTVAWLSVGASPLALALWVVVNRFTRIGPVLVVVIVIGLVAPGFLRRHDRLTVAAYAAVWLVTYALYLT